MSGILKHLLQAAHRFSPKCDHAVLWGWPDGEDSVIALEQALQETRVRTVVCHGNPAGKPGVLKRTRWLE
jgi:hypothetical protein